MLPFRYLYQQAELHEEKNPLDLGFYSSVQNIDGEYINKLYASEIVYLKMLLNNAKVQVVDFEPKYIFTNAVVSGDTLYPTDHFTDGRYVKFTHQGKTITLQLDVDLTKFFEQKNPSLVTN